MNADLLLRVADAIEAEPKRYYQAAYCDTGPCGTAFCVAGWAIHLEHPEAYNVVQNEFDDDVLAEINGERFVDSEAHAGAKLLDISRDESRPLFAPDNGPLDKDMAPADALRLIAGGAPIESVWGR